MIAWLVLGGIAVLLAGEVAVLWLAHRWFAWTKLTLVPWLLSISNAVNPERK